MNFDLEKASSMPI